MKNIKAIKHLLRISVVPVIAVMGWPGPAAATTVYDAYDITPDDAPKATSELGPCVIANCIDGVHIGGGSLVAVAKDDDVIQRGTGGGQGDVIFQTPFVWTVDGANTAITATDVSPPPSPNGPYPALITGINGSWVACNSPLNIGLINTVAYNPAVSFALYGQLTYGPSGMPIKPANGYSYPPLYKDYFLGEALGTDGSCFVGVTNGPINNPVVAAMVFYRNSTGWNAYNLSEATYEMNALNKELAPDNYEYDVPNPAYAFAIQGTNVVGQADFAKYAVCWHLKSNYSLYDVVTLADGSLDPHPTSARAVSGDLIVGQAAGEAWLWYGPYTNVDNGSGGRMDVGLQIQLWHDMDRQGGANSCATGVSKTRNEVVGHYLNYTTGKMHACVWNLPGDETTWTPYVTDVQPGQIITTPNYAATNLMVDLHQFVTNATLPAGCTKWADSCALAIDDQGDIVGYANATDSNGNYTSTRAILWVPHLELTAVIVGCDITLTWDAVPGASYYNVYRSTTQGGPYGPAQRISDLAPPFSENYDDSAPEANTTYYYVVRPVLWQNGGYMETNASCEAYATTEPADPTVLTAVGDCQSVTVSWNPSAGAAYYYVYRTTPGSPAFTPVATINDGTTTYTDTGLADSTTYNYTVYAANSANQDCPNLIWATATTKAAVELTCQGGPGKITLSWTKDVNADSYQVWRGTSPGAGYGMIVGSTTALTATDDGSDLTPSGLADNTSYYYWVQPILHIGQRDIPIDCPSAVVVGKTAPSPPPSLITQVNYKYVLLNLTPSPGATSYNLLRRTDGSQSYSLIATIPDGTTTYEDTGLDATTYYYAVVAVNSDGASSSNSLEVSVTPTVTVPAPTGLRAVGGVRQIALSWNPVPGATTYHVYNYSLLTGMGAVSTDISTTNYTQMGMPDDWWQFYVVTAEIPGLGEGMASSFAGARTLLPAPAGLQAVATNGQINLTWNAAQGATSYNVYRSHIGPFSGFSLVTNLPATACADTGLAGGTTYYYKVTAANSARESPYSTIVNATTAPSAPTGLTAMSGDGLVTLSWTAVPGATSYNVYRSLLANWQAVPQCVTDIASPTAAGYTDTSVTSGTTYYYFVSAVNSGGQSPNSGAVSATVTYTSTNMILNGGFETCDLGAWTATNPYGQIFVQGAYYGFTPHSGTCCAYLYGAGALSQTVNNLPVGQNLTFVLSFWVNMQFGATLWASWNGTNFFAATNWTTAGWQQIQYTNITYTSQPSAVLQFAFTNAGGPFLLDDVSVVMSTGLAPSTPPPAVTGLQAVAGDGQVTLNWNASPGALYYMVERGTNSGGEVGGVATLATNYTDTMVTNGITYYYQVVAENNSGFGLSSELNATPTLAAPTGLQAMATNGQVTLNWTASAGAAYYLVARSTSSGTEISIDSTLATNYTDAAVVNGTKYYYEVVSANTLGAAYASSEVSATPVGTAMPSAPKLGVITFTGGGGGGGGGGFGFSFTNVPSASFTVYATTNLAQPFSNWPVVGQMTETNNGSYSQYQFTDSQASNQVQRFYRVTSP